MFLSTFDLKRPLPLPIYAGSIEWVLSFSLYFPCRTLEVRIRNQRLVVLLLRFATPLYATAFLFLSIISVVCLMSLPQAFPKDKNIIQVRSGNLAGMFIGYMGILFLDILYIALDVLKTGKLTTA